MTTTGKKKKKTKAIGFFVRKVTPPGSGEKHGLFGAKFEEAMFSPSSRVKRVTRVIMKERPIYLRKQII